MRNLSDTDLEHFEKELQALSRIEARANFFGFVTAMAIEPFPAQHHKLIINLLDQVAEGVLRRLMMFMPPGYAKSTYASILFPPFYLAKHKRKKIVCGSYNTDLSDYFGKKARNLVETEEFREIWHENLDPGYGKAKNEWGLTNGSEYYATGVGAGVTGRRADIILIDDPIKGRKEADSPGIRKDTWNWYMTDIRSRKKPDAGIVIINTRWHEDDLCGRILNFGPESNLEEKPRYVSGSGWFEAYDHEMWYVLSLPAIAEGPIKTVDLREKSVPEIGDAMGRKVGEVLWPNFYTEAITLQERESQDERNWSALWQCRPSPEEGDYFKRENFRFFDELPEHLQIYGSSDYAVTDGGGDYTELGVGGVSTEDDLYIFDWWSGQKDSKVWIDQLFRLQGEHHCALWFEEKGQIEKSVGPFILKQMMDTGMYFNQKKIAPSRDKPTRAQTIRARFAQKKILFPAKGSKKHGSWVDRLIQQLLVFPAGTHDDMVDVMSLFGLGLLLMRQGVVPNVRPDTPGPYEFDQIARNPQLPVSPYRL